jgi:hypothetical protein
MRVANSDSSTPFRRRSGTAIPITESFITRASKATGSWVVVEVVVGAAA